MCVCVCVCMYVCMHVYMYVAIEEKNRETILSSLQACFVIDEWAITKQACSDESIVSLFFPPVATYITLYFYVSSTVKRKNQYTDFLYIYIHPPPPLPSNPVDESLPFQRKQKPARGQLPVARYLAQFSRDVCTYKAITFIFSVFSLWCNWNSVCKRLEIEMTTIHDHWMQSTSFLSYVFQENEHLICK